MLDNRQHGFRKNFSTVTQLLETVHDLASAIDRQRQVDIIYLDFEKAFDRVSHPKILLKLKSILQNDSLHSWIEAYLSNREQGVCIDDVSSKSAVVQSGVPQGSVLGPLLFLVFINDIASDIPIKVKLFADDCVLYHEIESPNDQATLNTSLNKIQEWCLKWQMTINLEKTVAMTITRKKHPLNFQYHVGNCFLNVVSSYKYLGVVFTSDLRWNDHTTYISNKARKKLGYLRRTLGNSTKEIKLLAYKTYVRPLLEYAAPVWDPYTQTNIDKLERVQRKASRFIFNSYSWRTSPSSLLEAANLEKLQTRRQRDKLKLFYLIYHDKLGIDKANYITMIDRRQTRSYHQKKVKDFACRTNVFKYSFFPQTTATWNSLPQSTVECPTVEAFTKQLSI